MRRGADAGGAVVDGTGLRLRKVDKLRQGAHAEGWSDVDQRRRIADQRNGGKVADRIERQVLVQRSQDGMTGIGEQDGVAVGGRSRDRLRRDEAARTGTICDDDLLAESL